MKPMLLKPVGKDYLWGGNRLKVEYGKDIDLEPLAETWECSTHSDGSSIVASGDFSGETLDTVLQMHPELLGKKASGIRDLPILVKFIDAKKDLSVQVHPADDYARKYEKQNGKTEMWYVLDAMPGASLICGFAHNVTAEQIETAVEKGQLAKHMKKIHVHKGDVFLIEPGTIHAIGEGIVLAEVQESSNVTYRVYDYDRIDKNGKKRELHLKKALEVLNMKPGDDIRQKPRIIHYHPGCSRELLCRCEYFEVEKLQISMGMAFSVNDESFQVLLCLEGEGGIENDKMHHPLRFAKGDCLFLPAESGRCHIIGKTELLKIRC